MSSNIYEDLNLTENVRYCKGARGDGGVKVERVVDIYESAGTVNDQHVDRSTQDLGMWGLNTLILNITVNIKRNNRVCVCGCLFKLGSAISCIFKMKL